MVPSRWCNQPQKHRDPLTSSRRGIAVGGDYGAVYGIGAKRTVAQEGIFVPLPPCRIYQSVVANCNSPIAANTTATVNITGQPDYTKPGRALVRLRRTRIATAVAVSVTTSLATSTGTLNASIPGNASSTPGTAITFTPSFSQTTGLAIGLIEGAFNVEPVGGSTNVTVVTGYWAPQIEAQIRADASIISSTGRISSASQTSTGFYQVTIDRDVDACSVVVSAQSMGFFATANVVNNVARVVITDLSYGSVHAASGDFSLVVSC